MTGPTLKISEEVHATKYRQKDESFKEAMSRVASTLADSKEHYHDFRDILLSMRFLPAGRVQASIGAARQVTAFNCFVSGKIEDSMTDIMDKAKEAAETMRLGGGIGYDFSTLRPRGDRIKSLDSLSSGAVSFMGIYNAVCGTVSSAGHRRGAQMGVLRIDHPDIEEFIRAKQNTHNLTNFNVSVGVTDEFMERLKAGADFDLRFDGRVYKTVKAQYLWDELMRSTWNWAEPGILFIDRINRKNNLWYTETIAATNPCGEQPLPPYGACLLGSFNLVKYVKPYSNGFFLDDEAFKSDIATVVRAMDNIIDNTIYPLPAQETEAKNKRRMGLGLTGVANAIEALGPKYGSPAFLEILEHVLSILRDTAYNASVDLAIEKGPFPLFDKEKYLEGEFISNLRYPLRERIREHGIRNSHLLSIAPTGTISLTADNVSSGIEPVFSYGYDRTIITFSGPVVERVDDYGFREFGVRGKTTDEVTVDEHISVLTLASRYVDSACSKTCNVSDSVSWEDFKNVYIKAYEGGASGCTTFRSAGKRYGILNKPSEPVGEVVVEEPTEYDEGGTACYFDPETGTRSCE